MPYVDAGGVHTYYETTGAGAPVVLLHGGFVGAESWAAQTPALAAAPFTVFVPERRGHGRTPDVDGPLSYDLMARDTATFLDAVVPGPAHLVGWSDGAVVGALVAMRRPELVDRLVLIGQYYNRDGEAPGGLVEQIGEWRADPPAFLRDIHDRTSPDGPGHFPAFFGKMLDMFEREPNLDLAELAGIRSPTLVLQGDQDEVRLEHSIAVVTTIPGARLAVLPGSHALPIESPDLVNRLVISFLRGGPKAPDWSSLA